MGRNFLFDVMFNMIDGITSDIIKLDGLLLKTYNIKNKKSKFDLSLTAIEKHKNLEVILSYCTYLFTKETVERMMSDYVAILETITNNRRGCRFNG